MKFLSSVAVAALIACVAPASTPAMADDIDLSTMTCKQFLTADDETIKLILTWLDGYYKDEDDPPVIDTNQFVDNSKKLGGYCRNHPDQGLITAADKVFANE